MFATRPSSPFFKQTRPLIPAIASQILETCVKNCSPVVYSVLSTHELWTDLSKMAADSGVTRVRGWMGTSEG